LLKHQGHCFLNEILLDGLSDRVPSEVLVEDLLRYAVTDFWSEILTVDDDLLLHVVLREPTSLECHSCTTCRDTVFRRELLDGEIGRHLDPFPPYLGGSFHAWILRCEGELGFRDEWMDLLQGGDENDGIDRNASDYSHPCHSNMNVYSRVVI